MDIIPWAQVQDAGRGAVSARGEFWFCTYAGGLNGELFIELLRQLVHRRKRPVRLILDSLPAHKRSIVRDYVASTAVAKGRETARPYRLRTRHRP